MSEIILNKDGVPVEVRTVDIPITTFEAKTIEIEINIEELQRQKEQLEVAASCHVYELKTEPDKECLEMWNFWATKSQNHDTATKASLDRINNILSVVDTLQKQAVVDEQLIGKDKP